ncbi:MAG TPA: NAD-dependent epimerase/dehydratase family protein [Verrucomicrobiota bacterium]|nr:NAD-dependent epimerase/dehydratase family protein [Verrucomicrobiota bacterium]
MNLLVTGICGFVGSALARALLASTENLRITGVDNFVRPGSELNRRELARLGVKVVHGDLRSSSDLETLPAADWVIDAAANPSVLAGVDGRTSSRQLVEHNLWGTVNALEYCKTHRAGLILLSTSRVYSIKPLAELPVEVHQKAYRPRAGAELPMGLTAAGVSEEFPTAPPVSLYGSTKLASESLALEYGETFGFPVWINRCGVLAGAGQFGKPDQGIFSYWINAHLRRRTLRYIGFDGGGFQVRDCLHPRDLAALLTLQMKGGSGTQARIQNVSGGAANSMSLAQLTDWCDTRFGAHKVQSDPKPRPFDIPWMVLNSTLAEGQWPWKPACRLENILDEIALHAEKNPNWLELSEA